ncbi:hypothetical protein ACJX0J_030169, partial [Zea mays]
MTFIVEPFRGWATLSASQSNWDKMTQQPSKTSRSESDFPGIPFLVVIVGFTLINCAGGECLFFCATLHFPFHLANKNGDHFPLRCILYINGALEDGVACTITECFHFNKASVLLVPIAACDPLVFQLFYKTLDFSLPFCTALAYFLIYSASFIIIAIQYSIRVHFCCMTGIADIFFTNCCSLVLVGLFVGFHLGVVPGFGIFFYFNLPIILDANCLEMDEAFLMFLY